MYCYSLEDGADTPEDGVNTLEDDVNVLADSGDKMGRGQCSLVAPGMFRITSKQRK